MNEHCQAPLRPRGLKDAEKVGLQPEAAPGHFPTEGTTHQVTERPQPGPAWVSTSRPQNYWVNGFHNRGHMSSCHPLTPREGNGGHSSLTQVSDLDISGLGLKHRSSNLQTPCSSGLPTLKHTCSTALFLSHLYPFVPSLWYFLISAVSFLSTSSPLSLTFVKEHSTQT